VRILHEWGQWQNFGNRYFSQKIVKNGDLWLKIRSYRSMSTPQHVNKNYIDSQNAECHNVDCQNVNCQNVDCQNVDYQNVNYQNVDCQNVNYQNVDCQNVDMLAWPNPIGLFFFSDKHPLRGVFI
jgi:uncharacterized protein YjbI with pentapeptide repeats